MVDYEIKTWADDGLAGLEELRELLETAGLSSCHRAEEAIDKINRALLKAKHMEEQVK